MVQRVSSARSTPGGAIGPGVCVLLGIAHDDDEATAERLAGKVSRLRIFEDDEGPSAAPQPALPSASKLDRSLLDVRGAALVVSQFTLIADTRKGNRPSFTDAAPPEAAQLLYDAFCGELESLGVHVERGVFGARMAVELVNDGPVTIVLDI